MLRYFQNLSLNYWLCVATILQAANFLGQPFVTASRRMICSAQAICLTLPTNSAHAGAYTVARALRQMASDEAISNMMVTTEDVLQQFVKLVGSPQSAGFEKLRSELTEALKLLLPLAAADVMQLMCSAVRRASKSNNTARQRAYVTSLAQLSMENVTACGLVESE